MAVAGSSRGKQHPAFGAVSGDWLFVWDPVSGTGTVALHKFVFLILGRLTFLRVVVVLLEAVERIDRFSSFGALSWLVISPLAVAVIHQEQALGTILLVPWIAWAWLTGRIWLAALLAGFSLNPYPICCYSTVFA